MCGGRLVDKRHQAPLLDVRRKKEGAALMPHQFTLCLGLGQSKLIDICGVLLRKLAY